MSGPKVVRIVTREEILEICRGQLTRVDAALEEWIRVGLRNGCVDDRTVAAARERRNSLFAMLKAERFLDIQKQAPQEEAFLRRDLQDRLTKEAEREADARSRKRRGAEAGASLIRALADAGHDMRPGLERSLRDGDAQALNEAFELLSTARAKPTGAAADLAAELRTADEDRSFAAWAERQGLGRADPAIKRIEGRLAEIAQLAPAQDISDMWQRLDEAARTAAGRRSLMIDGLEVESGRMLTSLRKAESVRQEARLTLVESVDAGVEAALPIEDLASMTVEQLEAETTRMRADLELHRSEMAAASRRKAVLDALRSIGYSATEGMETSVPDEGRLVVRSVTRPDYGVEVTTGGAGGKMQMRPVAFDGGGHGPDPARDRDAEIIWCGDVSALEERLKEAGGGLTIEKALPVGAVPLRRIALTGTQTAGATEVRSLRERSVPR